jgi:hypothetical protein
MACKNRHAYIGALFVFDLYAHVAEALGKKSGKKRKEPVVAREWESDRGREGEGEGESIVKVSTREDGCGAEGRTLSEKRICRRRCSVQALGEVDGCADKIKIYYLHVISG